MYDPPGYIWVLTFIGMIGVPGLTCVLLYRGANLAGLGRRRAAAIGLAAAVALAAWFTISGVIAGHGGYTTELGKQPPWLLIAFAGTLVALLAASRIPAVARALSAPGNLANLHLPHAFRVVGVGFLITMALGHLPAIFALPAGLGDIAVGISAPFVARRLRHGHGHRNAVWFNALGIADLVVALTIGGLTGFQLIAVTPSAVAITELPLALIPTAAVPLLLALHINSLRQLAARAPARQPDKVVAHSG